MNQSARVLAFEDLDLLYNECSNPVVLNELAINTESSREVINELVITTYNKSDSLCSIPMCNCKKTRNGYNEGIVCKYCDSVVTTATRRELKPDVFIRSPKSIPKMFNPLFWSMLYKALDMSKGKGTNGLRWLTDRRATFGKETKRITSFLKDFEKSGLQRGYVNVVNNFDAYFAFILTKVTNYKLRQALHDVYVENQGIVWCNYLPIPSKVAFVVEVTHVGTYYDKIMDSVIEAVYTAASIDNINDTMKVETRIATIQELLGRYYNDLMVTIVSSKPGLLRRDCYGSKTNFSFRNIITSLHEEHKYYNIHLPYSLVLTAIQPAVINVLCHKHNMSYKEAYDYTEMHAKDMDPLILGILYDFAAASNGGKGILISLTR